MTLQIRELAGDRPMAPRENTFTREFWHALDEGRFLVSQCDACGHLSFPPKRVCPRCTSADMQWRELGGRGRLYSLTRVHAGPPRFADEMPYAVAIVDLDEGVRLVTRMLDAAGFDDLDKAIELVALRYSDGMSFGARLCGDGDV